MSDDLIKRAREAAEPWDYGEPDTLITELADRIEAQAAEIERLREAGTDLRTYAEHDDGCASVQRWQTDQCNCGYIDAWRQWASALAGKTEQ